MAINSIPLLVSFLIIYFVIIPISVKAKMTPKGMADTEMTTCEEFSEFARFNPYSVLEDQWFVFYFWAPPNVNRLHTFTLPTPKDTAYLHYLLDNRVKEPVNWTAKLVLMKDKHNVTSLLVERDDRGRYWHYKLYNKDKKARFIEPADVRFKQTGDNKYIGMMSCQAETVIVMARIKDVPPKKKIQDEAARMGFRSRGGKSYLYQGHQWMPIAEADEAEYWMDLKHRRRFMYE